MNKYIMSLLAGMVLSLSVSAGVPRNEALSPVGVLIGASFEYCGPDHGCQGPRFAQYLQNLASTSNVAMVTYGRPGFTSWDFIDLANFIVEVKFNTATDKIDGVIIGTSGQAIGDPYTVLHNMLRIIEILQPYTHNVFVMDYPNAEPYNKVISENRDIYEHYPILDVTVWNEWRDEYLTAAEDAGAIPLIGVYDDWKAMELFDSWHITGPSSFLAALRSWVMILEEYL